MSDEQKPTLSANGTAEKTAKEVNISASSGSSDSTNKDAKYSQTPPKPVNSPPPPPAPKETWHPPRKLALTVIYSIVIVIAVFLMLYAWELPPFSNAVVRTNDAYVRGKTTVISPRVNGYVQSVLVQDFQKVKQDQVIVKIQSDTYKADYDSAAANLLQAEATASSANALAKRYKNLISSKAISQQDYDNAVAQANLANASIEQAKAALESARLNLGYTDIIAPKDGRLGEVSVRLGQYVQAGTQLMYLIPENYWVVASYKERDTKNIRIGQPAKVTVDALGNKEFKGKVVEIAPATVAEFSVTKPDTGTGNFVKVSQRIGVKIVLDPGQEDFDRLAPGMSVIAYVDTSSAKKAKTDTKAQ